MPDNAETPLFTRQTPDFHTINTASIKPWPRTGNNNVKASINSLGILTTVLLRRIQHDNYEYEVIDGTRRLDAITNNGEDHQEIPAFILPDTATDLEANAAAASLNLNRNVNPISEAKNFQAMVTAGTPLEAIAQQLGISISTIRARLKLLTLPTDILTAAENGLIATTAAQRITNLPAFITERLQATLADKGRITLEDVEEARKVHRTQALNTLPAALFEPAPQPDALEVLTTHLRTAITQAKSAGLDADEIQSALNDALNPLTTQEKGIYEHAPY